MTSYATMEVPGEKVPYLLRRGEGRRYVFNRQVAAIIADTGSTGGMLEIAVIAGAKGEAFPVHIHQNSYESIFVLEGKVEFMLNDAYYLLTSGDYVHIPPGTAHAYRMAGHRSSFVSFSIPGQLTCMYPILGEPYDQVEHPPLPVNCCTDEHFLKASKVSDIVLEERKLEWGSCQFAGGSSIPKHVSPYVLESGDGERFLTGDQLHRLLATQATTKGEYLVIASDGPKGDPIVEHYHEHHTETFFCVQGQLTMWINGEEVTLYPGDFAHVPPGTRHAYRFDTHYTKMVGLLVSGLFEPFFRALGDPYDEFAFPAQPAPLRMDRVMSIIDELDLKVVAKSPIRNESEQQ